MQSPPMRFLPDAIENYAAAFSTPEDDVLADLNRETHLKVLMPQMLSGHLQGNFLRMITTMVRPQRVLEVGTFTGYAAICMARGLADDGVLHTIDVNDELRPMVEEYVERAGLTDRIVLHSGDARTIIPALEERFDLVFIDADKVNYAAYYDMVFPKVPVGGFIIADNVLWSGKVTHDDHDRDTAALHAYNEKVRDDARVAHDLVPIRDGLMVARKLRD